MENNKHISDLSDSDFLSFLYSERERENNLHDFHGWNNWALVGAIVTIICTGYAILKNNSTIDKLEVLYYTICFVSFFLINHSLLNIFGKERNIDNAKVRMMKEVFPHERVAFIFIFGIFSSILIAVFDRCNVVFWLWISVIIVYAIVGIVVILNKEKIVPSFFKEMTLPWVWANVVYVSLIGGVFAMIMAESFKMAGRKCLSSEFELASCFAAIWILLYILFKLNFSNKVVMRFDVIIDKYLYAGATKEETFHEISKNRMGYGVLDACYKELQSVEKQTKSCIEEEKELVDIKNYILNGKCDLEKLNDYQARLDAMLNNQQSTLKLSKALVDRIDEIVKVSSSYKNITGIKHVFDTNMQCLDKLKSLSVNFGEVSEMLHEKEMQMLRGINAALKRELDEKKDKLRELEN